MNVLRSVMAARELHQGKIRAFERGEAVTFARYSWLYMLNHGQASKDECEVLWQDEQSVHVRKIAKPMRLAPNGTVRTLRFNPSTGRMECVREESVSEWRERERLRRDSTERV